MKKTRLEFVKGNSAKFWEISLKGTTQIVRYGRLGTEGSENEKSFASRAEAIKASQLLVHQKLKKGYKETSLSDPTRIMTRSPRSRLAAKNTGVRESVSRIKKWVSENHPFLGSTFNPPAKKSEITKLEKRMEFSFPPDVQDYFLTTNGIRFVDGMHADLFLGCGVPLRIEEISKNWDRNLELGDPQDDWEWIPNGAMQEVAFHKKWIPLSSGHVAIAVDMGPGPSGKAGQVITFATRWNFRFRYVVADSLSQYFGLLAANLENGRLTFFDEGDLDLVDICAMSFKTDEYLPLDCPEGLKQFHAAVRKPRKKK